MPIAVKVNADGFYIPGSEMIVYQGAETDEIILTPIPQDKEWWHPRYNRATRTWEEGLEEAQIAERTGTPQTLDELKRHIQQQIIDKACEKQESLTQGYSATEQSSWALKERESETFLANGKIEDAKYLSIEAIAMTRASAPEEVNAATTELARVILNKASELRTASALIAGTRARKWAEVEAMSDIESLKDYPIESGWPF